MITSIHAMHKVIYEVIHDNINHGHELGHMEISLHTMKKAYIIASIHILNKAIFDNKKGHM